MSGSLSESTASIASGTIIDGRFEVLDVLGRGGFATVYRGRQLSIDREVALKFLSPRMGMTDETLETFRERFLLEAKSAAQIQHPDIVTIHDYGLLNDTQPYIVMELLEGHDLGEELSINGPMAPERALPLFVRCLDALATAHDLETIHKDLKPSNLFLTGTGSMVETLRIVDFGIATLGFENDSRLTSTDQYIGTALYCVPEYYESRALSLAHDVYQMALILAETLTGMPVVQQPNAARTIMAHLDGNLELDSRLLESPLGPLLLKATRREAELRYQSAAEFRDALSKIEPATIPVLGGGPTTGRNLGLVATDTTRESPVSRQLSQSPTVEGRLVPLSDGPESSEPSLAPTIAEPGKQRQEVSDGEPSPDRRRRWLLLALLLAVLVVGPVVWLSLGPDGTSEEPARRVGIEAVEPTDSPPAPTSAEAREHPSETSGASSSEGASPTEPAPGDTATSHIGKVRAEHLVIVLPTLVRFAVTPSDARIEAIRAPGEAQERDGQLEWSLDPATQPPPWDISITHRSYVSAYLRVEPFHGELKMSHGTLSSEGSYTWDGESSLLKRATDGAYMVNLQLAPKRERREKDPKRKPFVD